MKNKLLTIIPKILLLSLFIGVTSVLSSCQADNNSNVLKIICINKGYGDSWINELKEKFESTHEGVTVEVKALNEAEQLIQTHLASSSNQDDLYISVGTSWKSNAAQGMFLDLTDLLDESVDGVTVKEKVSPEFQKSIYFTKSNGETKCYRLPFTSGIGGIFYNAKMFEENGWKIPKTYDELVSLCNQIVEAQVPVKGDADGTTAVVPFTYGGQDTDYFDYTVFNWWGQIAGINNIQEFLKYDSASNYDASSNKTYAALKTATNKWANIFKNKSYYGDGNSTKTSANAQKEFINGYAAMMLNGDWLYNETLLYKKSGSISSDFELKLMPTPVLSEANSDFKNTSYVIGEDQYIAIPKTSKKAELAKEFIKLMISNEGCETFITKAHGFLAYKTDYSAMNITDSYMLSEIELRNNFTSTFTSFSSNRKYLCNYIDVWCTSALRPYLNFLNGTVSIDDSFRNIANAASQNWSSWTSKSE